MVRVTNGLRRQRRHAAFRKAAKGFSQGRSSVYKQIRLALVKQGQHAYRGRKEKKRDFRSLWIERISAATRSLGLSYASCMGNLRQNNIILNRKVLAIIAVRFPSVFSQIVSR
ncbi:MAG: 50S ribosomal protein L20 [Candidatus Absconditabacterales bacterium]|nr:50S ribosomal protein L20 [Candidatus Absconditabacterales bacterium]